MTYEIDNPLTRALILHSALGGTRALAAALSPDTGTFAEAIGPAFLPPIALDAPSSAQSAIKTVESEASRQTGVLRALENTQAVLMPMLLLDERRIVGSVIDRQWLRQEWAASYLPLPQVGFGIVERVIEGLPLLTMIYLRPYL